MFRIFWNRIGSEGRDENNMVKVVTYNYFGSDLKKDVIGYNNCTKRGDIKRKVLRKENWRELRTV